MNKLIIKWKNTRYNKNNWISGTAKMEEILEVEKTFNEENPFPFKKGSLIKVSGNIYFSPIEEKEYILYADYNVHPTYGQQLTIFSMSENVSLKTLDDKKTFLQYLLTPLQVEELYNKHEDPFKLLYDENIPALIEVKGIGEIMAEKLIKRFKSTVDNAQAFIFFHKLGLTPNTINKLLREYHTAENTINAFKSNPYILAKDIDGIGFIKADDIALKYGIDKKDENRIRCGIEYFLNQTAENEGSTYVNPGNFKNSMVKLLGIDFATIQEIFNKMIEEDNIYANKDKKQIALKKHRIVEENISNYLKVLLKSNSILDERSKEEIEKQIIIKEKEQGFEFTDEQKDGIYKVLENNIAVITGGAGTGKTSVVNGFISTLQDNCSIAQCAFSAQAAKRMTEATGFPSQTIHRLLGYVPGLGFNFDENNRLSYDVIILDECSMVPLDLFWYLIRAIRPGSKLIILGDHRQLPPIGIGNLFTDLLNSSIIPKQVLTKIHRQAAKSAIITNSIKIRNMEQIVEPNMDEEETRGELQDFTIGCYQDKNNILKNIIESFEYEWEKNKNIKDLQVIVAMKERGELCQKILNNKIQGIVNPEANYKKETSISKDVIVRVGDKVINRKNNYNILTTRYEPTQVFNGSIGIVKDIKDDCMIIDFIDIGEVIYKSDCYCNLQLAYAITCHSCLPKNTLIYTTDGIKELGDLDNGANVGEFKNIDSNIKVFNGKYFEKPASFYNNGIDDIYLVRTKRGYSISATKNHKFNIWEENNFIKKELKDIKEGEYLVLNKNINYYCNENNIPNNYYDYNINVRTKKYKLPKQLTPELCRLLGCLVADGTIKHKMLRISKRHYDYCEKVVQDIKNIFDFDAKIQKAKNKNMYFVEVNSSYICDFLMKFDGVLPNNKYVPNLILKTTKENQCAFLQGLFEDGTVNVKNNKFDHIEFSQKNEMCIRQINMMLLNMGIITSQTIKNKITRNNKNITSYVLYIYREDAKIFKDNIAFICEFKNNRLNNIDEYDKTCSNRYIPYIKNLILPLLNKYNFEYINNLKYYLNEDILTDDFLKKILDIFKDRGLEQENEYILLKYISDNYYFDKIEKIEYMGRQQTYCLDMPETHNFVQNGLILGNSQGSQWHTTFTAFDNSAYILLSSEWVYTAMTRAKKKCYMYTETGCLRDATKRTSIKNRDTFLKELLEENEDNVINDK